MSRSAGALEPFAAFLSAPDAMGATESVSPVTPAAALAVALGGSALFTAAMAAGAGGVSAENAVDGLSRAPALLMAVPLAQLLCFPPLFLISTLRGRTTSPLRLGALAVAGQAAAGAVLGAAAPVIAMFSLSGPSHRGEGVPELAVLLLGVGVVMAAFLMGARNTLRASSSAGDASPGGFTLLAHYFVSAWTSAILLYHLA